MGLSDVIAVSRHYHMLGERGGGSARGRALWGLSNIFRVAVGLVLGKSESFIRYWRSLPVRFEKVFFCTYFSTLQ